MLLELEPAEVSSLLSDQKRFAEYVDDALDVLRAASDERALEVPMGFGADAVVPVKKAQPQELDSRPKLSVAVPNASEDGTTDSSLTPSLAQIGLRMSPRCSKNPYSTFNLLAGRGPVAVAGR
eukprot:scaffold112238_cov28-Tisochrysis_lutea.AAC.1